MGKHRKNKEQKDKVLENSAVEFEEETKEAEESVLIENDGMDVESNKVAKRRRKKLLYQSIREQMEFYFSDANLRKDRFLMQLIEQNEEAYVPIDVFLNFNKIRVHTTKLKDIAKACSYSEIIEVNDEKTMVKRKLPIVQKDNVDQCTLYIEKLPLNADHNWIRSSFNQFGQIVYISLPRFKSTDKIKGFAFVEFETPLSVSKACKFYKAAERLNDESQDQPKHKRKRGNSENDEEISRKRSRCNTEESESTHEIKNIVEEIVKEDPKPESTDNKKETADDEKKKKKKRRSKKKAKVVQTEEIPQLRVMSKNEWKKWKNKYLAMQKATMSEMKKTLLNENAIPPTLASPLRSQNDRNSKMEVEKEELKTKPFAIEFQKGVVVKLSIPSPVDDPTEFRRSLKEMGDVAYVDMKEDDVAFVRCLNPEATEAFALTVQKKLKAKVETLMGDDETKYWEKIHSDRENKSRKNKKQKGKKTEQQPTMKKGQKITIDAAKTNKRIIFSDM